MPPKISSSQPSSPAPKTSGKAVAQNFKAYPDGTRCAFLVPSESWLMGKVLSFNPGTKLYTCQSEEPPLKSDKITHSDIHIMRDENEEPNDLLFLTELSEPALLYALKRRYFKDVVYTNIGSIVVALNPFTFEIPHYKDSEMPKFLHSDVSCSGQIPHTWACAHQTYWEMRENRMNQTILVSGESGAGKTEAAKIVVKYVGILSTLNATKEEKESMSGVFAKVVAASPILESFGNAKTVRNDNSSRFGKFSMIQFNMDGYLVGNSSVRYLLEKSRIVCASEDERVYHSFYNLASSPDAKDFGIGKNLKAYKMLNSGNCIVVDSIDDSADYAACKQALTTVGVSDAEQQSLWKVVAGILSFQNVQFAETEVKGNKAAAVDPDFEAALERACEAWGVDLAEMSRELTTVTRVAKKERVTSALDKQKAQDTRDSCSKGLYDALFDWLVDKINDTTDVRANGSNATVSNWIGLLDIFGFEDFKINSFEQICINLANETLQNHYNNFIFTKDMEECKAEGIDVTEITFEDNRGCLALLALDRISVFGMLNDECNMGSAGSDLKFMNKLLDNFQTTKEKAGNKYFVAATGKQKDNAFRIKHYAGDVTYTVDGWLEKNRDTFKDDMKAIFKRGTDGFVASIVPEPTDPETSVQKLSVCAFFAKQLQELMAVINSTNPHWIRCIKPHPAKKPRMFSHISVMSQLRSAGVLETVKVRQAGYPIRFTQELFVVRYKILVEPLPGGAAEKCRALLFDTLGMGREIAQMGKSKVFLRQKAFQQLNDAKDAATEKYSLILQAAARGYDSRVALCKQYLAVHRERLLAEKRAREEATRRAREEAARRERAQKEERDRREAAERASRTAAVLIMQRAARRFLAYRQLCRCSLEAMRVRDDSASVGLLFGWRTSVLDMCDHRIAVQEALIKERRSRTAAELAAAQRQSQTNVQGGSVTVQQMVQRVAERRQELAQQTNERIAMIQKKRADQRQLFDKKLASAIEREKQKEKAKEKEQQLQQQSQGRGGVAGGSGTGSGGLKKLNNSSMSAAASSAGPSSPTSPRMSKDQLLDAEINRKLDMAKSRQDHRARTAAQAHSRMEVSAALHEMRREAAHNREQDDATRAVFSDVRDGWARQAQWKDAREDRFERDRAEAVERARRLQKKEAMMSSDYRPTAPSALSSPMWGVLEDEEQHHLDPYTGAPTRLSAEELRREALFQLELKKLEEKRSPAASAQSPYSRK